MIRDFEPERSLGVSLYLQFVPQNLSPTPFFSLTSMLSMLSLSKWQPALSLLQFRFSRSTDNTVRKNKPTQKSRIAPCEHTEAHCVAGSCPFFKCSAVLLATIYLSPHPLGRRQPFLFLKITSCFVQNV